MPQPPSPTLSPSSAPSAGRILELGTLTVRSRAECDAHVLALFGELDLESAPKVEAELRSIETTTPDEIVIDLRGLTFVDSTGLRLLIEAARRARGSNAGRLVLLRPIDHVFRVFEIGGIDALLPFESAPRDADG